MTTYQQHTPTCPHCGHAMNTDEMLAVDRVDLFGLAPREESEAIKCPVCDKEYWVMGGYNPHYTSAFSYEELE